METKVIIGEWNKHKIFEVWECDENGETKGEKPIVKMGVKKLRAIIDNTVGAVEFLKVNEK